MGLNYWHIITDKASNLKQLADNGDWPAVSLLGDELEESLRTFFEQQVALLTPEEQAQVKKEGIELMANIADILTQAKEEKIKINIESNKMATGKKGISAYKRS